VRAGHFSEASSELFSKDVYLCGCSLREDLGAAKQAPKQSTTIQASQNELAEPFKYSNSLHTSSTVVYRILIQDGKRSRQVWSRIGSADHEMVCGARGFRRGGQFSASKY